MGGGVRVMRDWLTVGCTESPFYIAFLGFFPQPLPCPTTVIVDDLKMMVQIQAATVVVVVVILTLVQPLQ
jgi:hypothetical protein